MFEHHPQPDLSQSVYEIVKHFGCNNGLEVGFGWGMSAEAFLTASDGILISVDPIDYWSRSEKVFSQFEGRFFFIEGTSTEILPRLTGKFDWICIDGDHSYLQCLKDLELAHRLLKQDGVILADDYRYEKDPVPGVHIPWGVKQAIDRFCREYGYSMSRPQDYGLSEHVNDAVILKRF